MAVRVVRLGSSRAAGEGLRIGTVRRPPRGVAKADFARRNYYDVWLPLLAPSAALVTAWRTAVTPRELRRFESRYRAEMGRPEPRAVLDLLAGLSHSVNFAVGCYCEDEGRCHRAILRELLMQRHAAFA